MIDLVNGLCLIEDKIKAECGFPDFGYASPNISFEPNCHRKVA